MKNIKTQFLWRRLESKGDWEVAPHAMTSLMSYLQVGGIVFLHLQMLPLVDIQEFGKTSVFFCVFFFVTLCVSCKVHLVFIHISLKRERKENIAGPVGGRPTA